VVQEDEDFLEEVLTYKKELKEINISQEVVVEALAEVPTDQLLLIKKRKLENKPSEKLGKFMMKVKKNLIVEVDHKLDMKEEAEVKKLTEQLCTVNTEVA
jgi:uncharacterized protein YpiB (UPF0302 family)